ncbi:hypothetical protein LOD99_7711 [Oopsacas minuta]|uniref:Uncharacterized protein n=1 Tax=Oopsacas minuta TaxID=111878 RepID=A0AAV7JPC6_9METZ|nr:hypothetical protein LOD99_7711 [Oopsacas minuta]
MIVRIDDFGDAVGPQKHRLLQMEYRWFTATLVEDNHERLVGLIPSLNSLQQGQGKYPGITLPKKRGKSTKRWFPQKKAEARKIWNKHEFYSQIWKIEKDQTRIILIVGALNNFLADILIQERPDTYQTLTPLPPGNFELSSNSPFAIACTNIVASKKHVLLAIGPDLLSSFLNLNLNPIVIVTYPVGLRTGGDVDPTSSSDGLLDASQLDQAQTTANQIRNEFGIFISGVASGSNLGEIYYQVCVLINENSYKKIDWCDMEPERKPFALSESYDFLDSFNKKSC